MAARQFGRYRLDRLIGRGAMGEVWLAHDIGERRTVALKILSASAAQDPDYRIRFEREARIGASLTDPHIVPIHSYGEQQGRLFLDMTHIPGIDVAGLLAAKAMTVPEAVDLVSQVADALDAAHTAGLIHRDVKPANIIVHSSGFAYLIDFGIARAVDQTTITATGFTVGTLAYMAPERFTGEAGPRSDVYSLACVLYECLTAQRPFGDTDPVRQLHAHLHQEPPRAAPVNPGVSIALDAVIARGMAKRPDQRYPTAGALAAAARAAIGMTHRIPRTPPVSVRAGTCTSSPRETAPHVAAEQSGSPAPSDRRALPKTRVAPAVTAGSAALPKPTLVATRVPASARVTPVRPTGGRRRGPVAAIAAVTAALVAFAIIMLCTMLFRGGDDHRTTIPATPGTPARTAPPDDPAPRTEDLPPPLTIPVPPGYRDDPPFSIPGAAQRDHPSHSHRRTAQ